MPTFLAALVFLFIIQLFLGLKGLLLLLLFGGLYYVYKNNTVLPNLLQVRMLEPKGFISFSLI